MRSTVRDLLVLSCAVSAGVHAALVLEHAGTNVALGVAFAAAAIALVGIVAALTHGSNTRAAASAAALVLFGLVASYVAALTTGIPLLHPEAEDVTGLALATKAVELGGLGLALALLGSRRGPVSRAHPLALTLVVVAFSALAAVAVGSGGASHGDHGDHGATHHEHGHAPHEDPTDAATE